MPQINIYLVKRTGPIESGYRAAVVCAYDEHEAKQCSPLEMFEDVVIKQIGISTLNLRGIVNSSYIPFEDI